MSETEYDYVLTRLGQIEVKLDQIVDKMTNVETMTEKVIGEVKPTIDELMQSSFMKMFKIGGKK